MDFQQMAVHMIEQNPQLASDPQAQKYIDIIKRNDSAAGIKEAQAICEREGISMSEVPNMVLKFFGLG